MDKEVTYEWFIRISCWTLSFVAILLVGFDQGNPLQRSKEILDLEISKGKWDSHQNVDITSQKMAADFQAHKITFIGNVEVRQADLILTADKITSVFGSNAQDIQEIIAEGNVRVKKGEKVATGQKAIYQKQKSIILVYGDPKLEQGESFVQGEKITIFLEQDQMEIQGRVKAEFQIPGESSPNQDLTR